MDETKNATQGARTQRGGGPDKARAKQRDGVGDVPVEVEVVGRSGCKGSWWANGGPGKVGGEGSPRDRPIALTQPRKRKCQRDDLCEAE
ncbi:hypothetical protein EV1_005411 [Malus domestica]